MTIYIHFFSFQFRHDLKPFGISVHIIEPGLHKTNVGDPQILMQSINRSWNQLSPAMREEYGQEFYDNCK